VLRFKHLELVLVRVLILCAPVVGVLIFFSWSIPLFKEGNARYVSPCRVLFSLSKRTEAPTL
jgi:hypothetical protein